MKRKIITALLFFILTLSACNIQEDNDIVQKQLIEITDVKGNIISQITDNITIKEFTKNEHIEQWETIKAIPDFAEKSYILTSYELITDPPIFDIDNKNKIAVTSFYLYLNEDDYYVEIDTNDNDVSPNFYKIPSSVGVYLLSLTEKTSQIQDKKDIFISWGIEEKMLKQSFILNDNIKDKTVVKDNENYDKYPYQDVTTFDYKGVKKASKYQKIEIYFNNKITYSTTDLREIADVLNNVNMQQWESTSKLPKEINLVCTLKKYAHPKKQSGTDLEQMQTWHVYKTADHYYLTTHMDFDIDMDVEDERFIIPNSVGTWFETKNK